MLGITEEQHADRCRLFAQWQGIKWPILHDPINVTQTGVVPLFLAIDERGIVRFRNPRLSTFETDFVNRDFADLPAPAVDLPRPITPPHPATAAELDARLDVARQQGTSAAWRQAADALVLWSGVTRIDDAMQAYRTALKLAPHDGDSLFRLGVCFRMRYDSPHRGPHDFQRAVDLWSRALAEDPNQYIWRRRIQQYGPRLIKPYPFYDWVARATSEITARGETPIRLAVAPSGAEIARPVKHAELSPGDATPPDPQGRIHRDKKPLIETEVVVVPAKIRPGATARVHVRFSPNRRLGAHWNNEAEPLALWIDAPDGWQLSRRLLKAVQPDQAESTEERRLEFELRAPPGAKHGTVLSAYALYYVCEEAGGTCLFLRHDVEIPVKILAAQAAMP